jgi:hypothetical protein
VIDPFEVKNERKERVRKAFQYSGRDLISKALSFLLDKWIAKHFLGLL